MPENEGVVETPNDGIKGDIQSDCAECGQEFVLTEGERRFFKSKALAQPRRCSPCRAARRQEREGGEKRGNA